MVFDSHVATPMSASWRNASLKRRDRRIELQGSVSGVEGNGVLMASAAYADCDSSSPDTSQRPERSATRSRLHHLLASLLASCTRLAHPISAFCPPPARQAAAVIRESPDCNGWILAVHADYTRVGGSLRAMWSWRESRRGVSTG